MKTALTAIALALSISCLHAESRTWTNNNGRKIQAELVSSDGKTAELKLANGKTARVPLQSLSKEDQDYVSQKNAAPASPDAEEVDIEDALEQSFAQPWPKASPKLEEYEVTVIKEDKENRQFIYETPHFRFVCDAKLGKGLMRTLSQMFEATYVANKVLPLGNLPWFVKDEKFLAYLYEQESDYWANGGKSGTAGYFTINRETGPLGKALVPFKSLGVKPVGSSYMVDHSESSKTLLHELTHQMMPRSSKRPSWLCEGSAEYVALSPYRSGRFSFINNKSSIAEYVTSYGKKGTGGRALGKDINAPSLKHYMTMPYSEFTGTDSMLNYGLAPLLAYYFYEVDGKGDAARIKKYIRALRTAKNPDDCLDILLDGRTWDQLEKEISGFWKKSGISLTFEKAED